MSNTTSVRRGFSFRFERLVPPKSPILRDSEPEILAQSPPILGDLGSSPGFTTVVNHFCRTDVNTELTFSMKLSSLHAHHSRRKRFDLLNPIRQWLDGIDVHDRQLARLICKVIPAQCPFERDINLFGRKVAHIPPMCKLNPLYDQVAGLRFRSLCYLVDECGETL